MPNDSAIAHDDGGVSEKLAGAKKALSSAESFSKSVESAVPSYVPPKEHEYSRASYSMPHKVRMMPDREQEAKSLGEGLKARMASEETARKSIQ